MRLYFITTGGGLGNQIMSYALWLYLKKTGCRTMLYLRVNYLVKIFNLKNAGIKKNYFWDFFVNLLKQYGRCVRLFYRLFHVTKSIEYSSFCRLNVIDYPEWENYKFINEILPELKRDLLFPEDNNEQNKYIMDMMRNCDSVSIHVRRGDYQDVVHWRIILGDICDKKYYEDAIEKVFFLLPKPVFFIFSDDIEWVKSNLNLDHPIFVDWNQGEKSFRDIQLMSYCKVNIIANSTFSLCASWLNVNINPIRIVPSKWLNSYCDNLLLKYIPSDWVVVNNSKPTISIIVNLIISEHFIKDILSQRYSDFELLLNNDRDMEIIDCRIKKGEINGRYIYNYTQSDSLKFKDRNYLWNWLLEIYTDELHG